MAERIGRLKRMLQELEAEISHGDSPTDIVQDFKNAVDDVRTSVWALMTTTDGSEGYRSILAQLRCARITEMMERVVLDLETGDLPVGTHSFLLFRERVLAMAEQLTSQK